MSAKQHIDFGILTNEFKEILSTWEEEQLPKRLFAKDAYLWGTDIEQAEKISKRLGWIDLPANADELIEFSNEIKEKEFRYVVVAGMGGSSLCSEVARQTFGSELGYPELLVLDNTAPAAIIDLEKYIHIEETLFIAASKSGNTMETISFSKYFYEKLQKQKTGNAGDHFIAITDADTPLVEMANQYKFRKVFINPSDIGGRYSVLSNFGLLPMALMGIDIKAILTNAETFKDTGIIHAISLGLAIGLAQQHGRDKLTFVLSSSVSAFGLWVEQLIAESTGKQEKGLIPVAGELLSTPDMYGKDRVFIHMYLADDDNESTLKKIEALKKAGHPVVSIELRNKLQLGAEYYRWEIATAVAGIIMHINPFDEPNVAEGKKNTNDLLKEWNEQGEFNRQKSVLWQDDIKVYSNQDLHCNISLKEFLKCFIGQAKPGDYIALLAYLEETPERTGFLQEERMQLRNKLKIATTIGYGPRYLHSTGQLHKGGPDTGLYIIITADDKNEDIEIPGETFSFGTLHQAQALGDFRSLSNKGRRVVYLQLGKNINKNLEEIYTALKKA